MSDDDEEKQNLWTFVGLGAAAVAGALWWLGGRGRQAGMSETQAQQTLSTADPLTLEGRREIERAQVAIALARRARDGEPIDEGIVALERLRSAMTWDFGAKGTHYLDALKTFEKVVTRPLHLDPADLRKDRRPHHVCAACQGAGEYFCPRCHGRKNIELRDFYGHRTFPPCPECGGAGTKVCEICHGGRVLAS